MTLLEAFKHFSVENLDTEELLIDINYNCEEDEELYDAFIHNLKCLCYNEKEFEKLANIEMTPDFMEKLKENDTDEIFDDNINQLILSVAWLTYNEYDYAEREANDELGDLSQDEAKYEISFGELNLKYEYETDIDLL